MITLFEDPAIVLRQQIFGKFLLQDGVNGPIPEFASRPASFRFTIVTSIRPANLWKSAALPARNWSKGPMGPVRLHHSSHDFGWQSSHSVDLAGWQAKMVSIEIWIP